MDKKKVLGVEEKLKYDDIVNIRKDVSELKTIKNNVPALRLVCISTIVLAIIFGSLLLFRII